MTHTVLDTHFAGGHAFVDTASAWLDGAPAATVLHYVALCSADDLAQWREAVPSTLYPADAHRKAVLLAELQRACESALPGIQRLLLAQGRISLTLCAGPLQAMLSAQSFQADEVRLPLAQSGPATVARWDKWALQLMARRCRRGAVVSLAIEDSKPDWGPLQALMATLGFEWASPSGLQAVYNPGWELRTTRTQTQAKITKPQRCAVVGAGLAGASVAQALALRGWQVTVLDAHAQSAQGASGLPVGLVVPQVSADDSPRSRMSRVGARLTLHHAHSLLRRGQDWDGTGVMELNADADRCLTASGPLVDAGWLARGDTAPNSLWHAHAGWIKPARLVAAWLAQPAIQTVCGTRVQRIQRVGSTWLLHDALGQTVAEAELVVVANAMGALPLLQNLDSALALAPEVRDKLRELQALHGTISHGAMPTAADTRFAPFPVNGSGSLVANVPTALGPQWYAGATYETDANRLQNAVEQHAANWERLRHLQPTAAQALQSQFADQRVDRWTGTRCVAHDRLPLVGPAHADASSGLWLSLAMGSRGLTFAALCAELLAARLTSEPLPIEARLASSLDVHRPRRQRARGSAPG